MTPLDHLQAFTHVFNRALSELPASQRQILADLAKPYHEEVQRALTPPAEKPAKAKG